MILVNSLLEKENLDKSRCSLEVKNLQFYKKFIVPAFLTNACKPNSL